MPANMCPKSSKKKTKIEEKNNKHNIMDGIDKSKVMRKKTKGEIKHDKKMMKRKAKLADNGHDDDGKLDTFGLRGSQETLHGSNNAIDNGNGIDNANDLDLSTELSSAFVQSIIEKSGLRIGKDKEDDSRPMKMSFTEEELQDDYLNGFKNVKKGKVAKPGLNKTSEGFGFEAYKYIIEGKKDKGNEFLTRALALDHFDVRHYFNRSYSQLCTGNYEEALSDIQFVINHNDDQTNLARMKCRQGQIFKQMQQFEKAEECFKDCLNLFPNSIAVRCEFMRMKIAQLESMGFPESDIIALLYDCPFLTLREAITFLTELSRLKPYPQTPSSPIPYSDTEEYQSDTEENPCNTRLFMEMVNFNPHTKDDVWYRDINNEKNAPTTREAKPTPGGQSGSQLSDPQSSQVQQSNTSSAVKELRVINASGAKKVVIKGQCGVNINNRAVWVGSLTTSMTESVLRRAFSTFGPVASVYRAGDSACAFINFENVLSANLALEAETLEVLGKALPIKLNKRSR